AEVLRDLRDRLDALEQRTLPFAEGDPPHGPGVHWVKPTLVAEIEYAEWTQNGLLRQPRFEGLRMDKKATQVRREKAKSSAAVKSAAKKMNAGSAPARGSGSAPSRKKPASVAKGPTEAGRVTFTHVEKLDRKSVG